QSTPPGHREMHDWHIDKADDTKHCGIARSALGATAIEAEQQICDVDEPKNQRGRQYWLAIPPRAPVSFAPNGATDEHHRCIHHADLRRGARQPVPALVTAQQIHYAADEDDEKREKGKQGHRHMEVHDALYITLYSVRRGQHERCPD